jgi:hypothetical protein
MILVIQTQDYENYAAHEGFDGSFRWKAKGGSEFLITGVDAGLYTEAQIVEMVRDQIERDDEYFQTQIIGAGFESDDYMSWFEKSQLDYEGKVTHPEPRITMGEVVGRWLNLEDPREYAEQAADADAVYYGA